ncbi:MAG: nitroreductase family protein [Pseudomonadales bacterium]
MEKVETHDFLEIIYNCRAMRRIKPEPVPEELLVKLVDAANQGPTASNAQPGRWIIVTDPGIKMKLADLNRSAVDKSYPAQSVEAPKSAFRWQYEHMQDIPVLIVACVSRRGGAPDTFYAGVTAGGSIWPSVQNLLLTARALGLGACPTTLPLQDRAAAKAVLNMPEHVEPICMIPVGYPKGKFGPVKRRPLEQIVHWDGWNTGTTEKLLNPHDQSLIQPEKTNATD